MIVIFLIVFKLIFIQNYRVHVCFIARIIQCTDTMVSCYKKVKGTILMELRFTATGCHLSWITQCYLPPDTSEHTPP